MAPTLETAKQYVLRHYEAAYADKRKDGWYLGGCPAWLRAASGPCSSARLSWSCAASEIQNRAWK